MRDKLIHAYFGLDIGQVWLTATVDLPALKVEVESILKKRVSLRKEKDGRPFLVARRRFRLKRFWPG